MSKTPKNPSGIPENMPDEETVISPIQTIRDLDVAQSPALLAIAGPHIGRTFTIDKTEVSIGRIEACDILVEGDLVSRQHCKITLTAQGVELQDLASTNGTLVNGRKVERVLLKEGDQIQVGSTTIFKFHLQEEVERKFLGELFNAATKDFLTSTYNKKYFLDRLQTEFYYTQRHGGNLSVLVLDIDFFKKVNDTYGHLAGDIALQKMSHFLISNTRKDDLVARFGGEEFVVLMRDCDIEQARLLAENLRSGISKLTIKADQKEFQLTVSVGVASLSADNRTRFARFESLLECADTQLYRAKETGRNKVCA